MISLIPIPVLFEMVKLDWRLLRFALLFREYTQDLHRLAVKHHSRIERRGSAIRYYFCDRLHRDQYGPYGAGPAVITIDGRINNVDFTCSGSRKEVWYYWGRIHRNYMPAYMQMETDKTAIYKWITRGDLIRYCYVRQISAMCYIDSQTITSDGVSELIINLREEMITSYDHNHIEKKNISFSGKFEKTSIIRYRD